MAGYSGTPLVKKLGIKAGARILFVNAPRDFQAALGELPEGVKHATAGELDFAIVFTKTIVEVQKALTNYEARLAPAGMLWFSWPKKASGVATELTEGVVQKLGLAAGLVDIKVCAVDDVWSGLKFVRRVADRKPAPGSQLANKAGKATAQ